jgi:hypothetical protein
MSERMAMEQSRVNVRGTIVAGALLLWLTDAHAATPPAPADETALVAPQTNPSIAAAPSTQKLRLSSRREGIIPYLPGASHRISIRVPEEAIRQGWRCCWIDAFSRETANQLSAHYRKTVAGNDADVMFDAARAEASLRQVAPGVFEGYLPLASSRRVGSHAARLYVHLYRHGVGDGTGDVMLPDDANEYSGALRGAAFERGRYRYARNFLDEPVLIVRFAYAPHRASVDRAGAPPSQLPN